MALDTEKLDLYLPPIDNREEETLYAQAVDIVGAESQGQLTDTSDGNPLGVLLRGQAFTGAEFLYQVNKIPLAIIVQFLSLAGVERSLGQKASGNVTFTLTAARTVPFTIPQGFEVTTTNGQQRFFTKTQLVIPAGQNQGSVTVEAEETGSEYNVGAYTVSRFVQPLTFLASVINTQPIQGGASAEPVEDAINRGMAEIRRGNLVSEIDFREAAEQAMGSGSRAKAIGLLGGDKITITPGAIHVFCLAPDGEPASSALLNVVSSALDERRLLGTTLHVNPMDISPIDVKIYANTTGDVDAETIGNDLFTAFESFLNPTAYEPGDTVLIEEVRHQLRFVEGISHIDYILLNEEVLNIAMPNDYTIPVARSLSATLINPEGVTVEVARGLLDNL